MQRLVDGADNEATDELESGWNLVIKFLRELLARYRLLIVVMVVLVVGTLGRYMSMQPVYTATAVIGPPGPSPTSSFMSGADNIGRGSTGSVARRLLGGPGAASTNDPFQEYLQLLQSVRLTEVLIEKDHILQQLFPTRWDAQKKAWRPPGTVHEIIGVIKRAFHRPVKDAPDVDTLTDFLRSNLQVETGGSIAGAKLSPLLGAATYPTVTFDYVDPQKAKDILNTILLEADNIIRQDQRKDVSARLTFLKAELPKVMSSDQRDALISVMSGQQQLQMMIEADKRFASTLIDPPYASETPTSPINPKSAILGAMMFSIAIWIGLVFFATRFKSIRAVTDKVERVVSFGRFLKT